MSDRCVPPQAPRPRSENTDKNTKESLKSLILKPRRWSWQLDIDVHLLSLPSVFECAYAQLVLSWYDVPEPREHQPLHQVLCREFDFVIDRIIDRAKDFDVCQAVVGSIRILTQHLHNVKQPDRWDLTPALLWNCCSSLLQLLFALSNVPKLYKCLSVFNHLWIIYHTFTGSYLRWRPVRFSYCKWGFKGNASLHIYI